MTSANETEGEAFALVLCDTKPALCEAFRQHFAGFSLVTVIDGPFQTVPDFDCVVSSGNSFGLMDGGIDLDLVQFFGPSLEKTVQSIIRRDYLGEQPVGTCALVPTGNVSHPFVAHAPTMRVPLTISRTDNVYRAFRAVLLAVHFHNQNAANAPIKTLACSGLGTGVGQVPLDEAARQMKLAYQSFLSPPPATWKAAHEAQAQIRYGGDFGFRIPPTGTAKKP